MEINLDDCWLYAGTLNNKGYGKVFTKDKEIFVHRLMWEAVNSQPIPEGLQIDHLCRVHGCINPIHLEPVTPRENVLRGFGPAAQLARRTACKYGHEFTKENTRMEGNTRRCRTCCRKWQSNWKKAHKINNAVPTN